MGLESFTWNTTGVKKGEDIERGFFGTAGQKRIHDMNYLPYREGMAHAMEHQPARLPPIATSLLACMDRLYPALAGKVKFYTAVGTPLDVYHGVDAFCLLQNYVVTLDVTTNPEKESSKADILIHTNYTEDGGIDFGEKEINDLAKQIGTEFIDKIKLKGH